jgi:hypothetical protein
MIRRIGLTACALVLLAVTVVAAQQVVTGTVVRIDQPAGVVVLDNGQMYQATPQTVFLVNNQPSHLTALAPGTPVVVHYGQPVMVRDGRYVVMTHPAPAGTVVHPAPTAGVFEVSGVVKYADSVRRIVRFEDGRNISIDENVQLLWNGSPVMLSTVAPGTFVVARSSKPLAFRDNTYYVATAPAGTTVVTTPPPAVVTSPSPVVGAPITGTVVRFDQPNHIVLSDGRVIPATQQTVVMVDNRAVPYTALQPGMYVVIYPNGQGAVLHDPQPSAFVGGKAQAGLREEALEHNAP